MARIYDLVPHRQSIAELVGYNSFLERVVAVPVALIIVKLFRLPVPNVCSDDPPVERLTDLEVSPDDLPTKARGKIAEIQQELEQLGFESAVCYSLYLPNQQSEIYQVFLRDSTGTVIARISYRHSHVLVKHRLFTSFLSVSDSGDSILTTNGHLDSYYPRSVHVIRKVGEPIERLLERHQRAIRDRGFIATRLSDDQQIRESIERLHEENVQYQLDRGFYKPLRADSPQAVLLTEGPSLIAGSATTATDSGDQSTSSTGASQQDSTTAEIVRLMEAETTKSSTWTQNLMLLIVSLGAFIAFSAGQKDWSWTLLTVPALFIHELGHFVLMRACGYRNTKIFFIPFFGAAASGINFNVPGWKRIMVFLAGPFAGLAAGGVVGIAGIVLSQPLMMKFAVVSLILNLFNLLPIVPLDGGWVMFHILFCRHPVLNCAFRACGALGLALLAILTGQIVLGVVAFFMLAAAVNAYKVGEVAQRLRDEGIEPAPEQEPGINHNIAVQVASGIRDAFKSNPKLQTKFLSVCSLEAYGLIHARPPGVLPCLLFLGAYGGSIVAGIIGLVILWFAQNGQLLLPKAEEWPPKYSINCGTIQSWEPVQIPRLPVDQATLLMGTLKDDDESRKQFEELQTQLPAITRLTSAGPYLFVTCPKENKLVEERIGQRLSELKPVFVIRDKDTVPYLRMTTVAPDATVAETIGRDLKDFTAIQPVEGLIPPWAPVWIAGGDEIVAFQKARRSFLVVESKIHEAAIESRLTSDQMKQLQEAARGGARQDVREIMRKMQEQQHAAERKQLDRLPEIIDEKLDRETVELFIEWRKETLRNLESQDPTENRTPAADAAWKNPHYEQMRKRLGSFAADDQEMSRLAVVGMTMKREGTVIESRYVQFENPDTGFPALFDWLCRQGCRDTRFDFLTDDLEN